MLYWYESYRYEFTPVLVPVRNIRTSMKSDHILFRYHVKEVQGFVPVGDEWPSWLGRPTGSECLSPDRQQRITVPGGELAEPNQL